MSTYALQTKTMLQSTSKSPIQLLGHATKRDESKLQLPSKRKREAICGLGTSNKPITIKPYPKSPYDKPVTFKPVRVIRRSQLPLTFLDTTPDDNFASNSLFSSQIDVLESHDERQEDTGGPKVLIARYETKRALYAIERVRPQVYSICRLASWLKEMDVSDLWDPSNIQAFPAMTNVEKSTAPTGVWWEHAMVETQPAEQPAKRARLAMMRKKQTPAPAPAPAPAQETAIMRFDTPVAHESPTNHLIAADVTEEPSAQIPAQELLEAFVQQYLNTVYMSKTSLAYFAKGPVTRIRNAFTSPDENAPPQHELLTFLRSMLFTPKASEKKYYEKIPAIIKALPPGSFSDEELVAVSKTKKTKKKLKLSREGVYPHEEALIKRWWISDTSNGDNRGDETMDQRIKRRIGDLRVRETLAQLTLMLEVITLEALSTYKPPLEVSSIGETQPPTDSQAKPTKRKNKFDDIRLQLDLLLDKLCIWHATEEAGILDFDSKPAQQWDGAEPSKSGASDRLRDFCIEVIVPFYINRLPEQAVMINRRLGGPAPPSPLKRKAMKPPKMSHKSGEPKEPDTKKSRRSLGRVATETIGKSTHRVTPSLSRSATDSALIKGIKREGSEAPLSATPFQRSPSVNNRRSMSQFRHLEGRELDLTTPSAAVTAKLKQKQRVEDDLKEAITALKKPNRGLAAGGYIDDLERRNSSSIGRSRKQLNPTRKVVKDIQVTATPRVARRTKDMVEHTPNHAYRIDNPFARHSASAAASSNDFCIPSSGVRQATYVVPGTVHRSATARQLTHGAVAETPSKAPSTRAVFESGAARRTIFTTPSKSKKAPTEGNLPPTSHLFESPVKVTGSSPPPVDNEPHTVVGITPIKSISASFTSTVPAASSAQPEGSSIYAALGWDDEDDVM